MALSSVVNRVTLGQCDELKEAMASIGLMTSKDIELACEATLYDGRSGEVILQSKSETDTMPILHMV